MYYQRCMKASVIFLWLGAAILFAAPPEGESIAAGPFRVTVPKAFAKGVVVEKVAFSPLYSEDAWVEKELDPSRQLKPGYCNRPQHWAIRLPEAVPEWYKQILIHKSDEWASTFENGKIDAAAAATFVAEMRRDLALWVKQPVNRISPAYMDASTAFDCLKKQIQFEGGSGVRGIVQWNIEAQLARRTPLPFPRSIRRRIVPGHRDLSARFAGLAGRFTRGNTPRLLHKGVPKAFRGFHHV